MYKLAINLIFIFSILFVASKAKEAKVRLQYETFNETVIVEVVDLPLCINREGSMSISYRGKNYYISIDKNDCINGKYKIGDKLSVEYNPKLDEMQPRFGFWYGSIRLLLIFLIVTYFIFWVYGDIALTRKKTLQKNTVVSPRMNKPVRPKRRK